MVARDATAPGTGQREIAEAWEASILGSGLPVAWSEGAKARPRISFGAPLPIGMAAERDLVDVILTERLPLWQVREALADRLPDGWRLVELHDVWLAGPPLAGRVMGADFRVHLGADAPGGEALQKACAAILGERRLPRRRPKGDTAMEYDLRPLLLDVGVIGAGPPPLLHVRTRFHPELGTGRPDEVVAALGDVLGVELAPTTIVRERLLLSEDLGLD